MEALFVQGVSVQGVYVPVGECLGVNVQGISVQGVYVLGVSVQNTNYYRDEVTKRGTRGARRADRWINYYSDEVANGGTRVFTLGMRGIDIGTRGQTAAGARGQT